MIWDDIISNFNTVMAAQTATYTISPDTIDLELLPGSVFDRSYSIQMHGINAVKSEVNNYLYFDYDVRLQLAYALTPQSGRTSYTTAIDEIEAIIKSRLTVSSFTGTFNNVVFLRCSPFDFKNRAGEYFAVVSVDFRVTGSTTV